MKYDGVIFDLDGTLWDSGISVADSWNETLAELGYTEPRYTGEDIHSVMGLAEPQIAEKLFPAFGSRSREICALCLAREVIYVRSHGGILYPGVEELLKRLRGRCGVFIVSNCQAGYIDAFLDFCGFRELVAGYACAGENGRSKGENIRLIAESFGLKDPVYVGDTVWDQRSAAEAGCAFIHAAYGFGAAEGTVMRADTPLKILDHLNF